MEGTNNCKIFKYLSKTPVQEQDGRSPIPTSLRVGSWLDTAEQIGTAPIAAQARQLEELGFDRAYTAETSRDPFLPLVLAADQTKRLELGTSIAVAFARNPMNIAVAAQDLNIYSGGASASAWARRSGRTSSVGSTCPGTVRRNRYASSFRPSEPSGIAGSTACPSISGPRIALTVWVRWRTRSPRVRNTIERAWACFVLTATNRIVGR